MKYIPKEINENVNVSKTHPLKEFSSLLIGLFLSVIAIYIILGFVVDLIIPVVPAKFETKIAGFFEDKINKEKSKNNPYVDSLFNELVSHFPNKDQSFKLHIVDNRTINALALPGGHIVLFQGLIDEVESENELIFILGHELGHINNRDHLKGMGRGLVLVLLSSFLSVDDIALKIISGPINATESKFSQKQEIMADRFGLDMLNAFYGHCGGALSFFNRISSEEELSKFEYFFSTHPNPQERVNNIKERINLSSFKVEEIEKLKI